MEIEKWRLEVNWGWGRDTRFDEQATHTFFQERRPTDVQIQEAVEAIATKIAKRYTYDCDDKSEPLNPCIYGLSLIPQAKTEYLNNDLLSCDHIFEEYKKEEENGLQ